jgi:hypothetical protein
MFEIAIHQILFFSIFDSKVLVKYKKTKVEGYKYLIVSRDSGINLHSTKYRRLLSFRDHITHVMKIARKSTILSRFSGRLIVRLIAINRLN